MCIHFEKNRLKIYRYQKKLKKIESFLLRHVAQKKRDIVLNRVTEAPFYKERFATNQNSLRIPVAKLLLNIFVCEFPVSPCMTGVNIEEICSCISKD